MLVSRFAALQYDQSGRLSAPSSKTMPIEILTSWQPCLVKNVRIMAVARMSIKHSILTFLNRADTGLRSPAYHEQMYYPEALCVIVYHVGVAGCWDR